MPREGKSRATPRGATPRAAPADPSSYGKGAERPRLSATAAAIAASYTSNTPALRRRGGRGGASLSSSTYGAPASAFAPPAPSFAPWDAGGARDGADGPGPLLSLLGGGAGRGAEVRSPGGGDGDAEWSKEMVPRPWRGAEGAPPALGAAGAATPKATPSRLAARPFPDDEPAFGHAAGPWAAAARASVAFDRSVERSASPPPPAAAPKPAAPAAARGAVATLVQAHHPREELGGPDPERLLRPGLGGHVDASSSLGVGMLGLEVEFVSEWGPAYFSGQLRKGDVVSDVNGRAVSAAAAP